jgi:hypothetical protein
MDGRGVEPWWSSTVVNEHEIARGDLAKDGKPKGFFQLSYQKHQGQCPGLLRRARVQEAGSQDYF